MKISIITPSYNSKKTLSRTIESVVSQECKDIEYIIIDGGSTDGTLEIINEYKDKISKKISEKDNGIYDAINKGINLATGDVIGILNSDDFYDNNKVLQTVLNIFEDSNIDAIYGDINYFANDIKKTTRYWEAGEYDERKLNNGWAIPHPALFLRKSVYDKCGLYNVSFKIAGDYEFILRILKIYHINLKYISKVLVRMYDGGISGRNFKQRRSGWKELKKAWLVNNIKIPRFFILKRIFYKISQYFTF